MTREKNGATRSAADISGASPPATTTNRHSGPLSKQKRWTGMRSLYHDGMVRIVVTPNWAKLIDFEATLPSAVEEVVQHGYGQVGELSTLMDVENVVLAPSQGHQRPRRPA